MRAPVAFVAAVLSLTALSAEPVVSQAYPSRPITIVVPFAAGGPLDTLARILSQRLGAELGQSIVVETSPVQVAARALVVSHVPQPTDTRCASATGVPMSSMRQSTTCPTILRRILRQSRC
jgi:hypothetical protein